MTEILIAALIQLCAPAASKDVMAGLLRDEWRQSPYLVFDKAGAPMVFKTAAAAAGEADKRLAAKQEVWLGLAQVHAAWLQAAGYALEDGVVPCLNLEVAAQAAIPADAELAKAMATPPLMPAKLGKFKSVVARYFSADTAVGNALAGRVVDAIVAGKVRATLPEVPLQSGEYRQAFNQWSEAKSAAMARRVLTGR